MLNNPVIFNDPTGHEPKYGDGACYEIGCKNANGTPVAEGNGKGGAPKVGGRLVRDGKGNAKDILNDIEASSCFNGNPVSTDCLSDLSYFSDNLGLVIATGEMVVTDTIGTLIIAGLCEAGLGGCAVGVGVAGILDVYVAGGHPIAWLETNLGVFSFAATSLTEWLNNNNRIEYDAEGLHLYISQDNLVSFSTMVIGFIPEANIDFAASAIQLDYDNARRGGLTSNPSYDLTGWVPNLWGCGSPALLC